MKWISLVFKKDFKNKKTSLFAIRFIYFIDKHPRVLKVHNLSTYYLYLL